MTLVADQRPVTSTLTSNGPSPSPAPASPAALKSKSDINISIRRIQEMPGDQRTIVAITNNAQDSILRTVADVLGRPWRSAVSLANVREREHCVVGLDVGTWVATQHGSAIEELTNRNRSQMLVIYTRNIDQKVTLDADVCRECDYEFLYQESPFFRRDLTRFLSMVLGQARFHEDLSKKERTWFISTTFPDVRTALSNLDILTVGADAVEIRVDLLKETHSDGSFSSIPSLKYVGEQVMLLRQRTELPIIFTTRCTRENGRFPMENPQIYYDYLRRAIQWGVEYIDVELWLPEEIRKKLWDHRGNSRIISAFHDFSGNWKWPSEEAQHVFKESAKYADIVKMIVMVNSMAENYELEYFRSTIRANYAHPPLSAVNMGQMGQLSRALNTVFSPITHPLLPIIAAPGQLSVAEINGALHVMGQLPKRDLFAIGSFKSTPQSVFFEKCFNELGLPHHFACVNRAPRGSTEAFIMQPNFGGAYINPPLSASQPYLPSLTPAAQAIGLVDTVVVHHDGDRRMMVGENAMWKGIRATLTRDFVPSAYQDRVALLLASSEAEAAPAIFALQSLNIGKVYTVGFRSHGPLGAGLEPFTTVESIKKVDQPFVIISALPPEKSLLVQPLLRHYSGNGRSNSPSSPNATEGVGRGKVFVDLANGPRKGDPLAVATTSGWTAYGIADVGAWTTVETLRLLVGQNIPFDFVRMASGRGLY
ncbi:hypothetical protein MMC25_002073 [Agyrium rufum]|nr:hypothetical protein [Agyrium rufum]